MSDSGSTSNKAPHAVFVSYSRTDSQPPTDKPKALGFVDKLVENLRYDLEQNGVEKGDIWIDRKKIENGEYFESVIMEALEKSRIMIAVLSRNYVKSDFCKKEVDAFKKHLGNLQEQVRERRIFRVDRHDVKDEDMPEPLRGMHTVRFFEPDPEAPDHELEFYRHGEIKRKKQFKAAMESLASSIYLRLKEDGYFRPRPGPESGKTTDAGGTTEKTLWPPEARAPEPNGRTIFVAKPASDLRAPYETLVRELEQRGYKVVPDPKQELPNDGSAAVQVIQAALKEAETSVHQIGERRGFIPEGVADGIVALQLAEAANHAKDLLARQGRFERLIWAPKILPEAGPDAAPRDPMDVVASFNAILDIDQIDGDTASRFNEFVWQHLTPRPLPPRPKRTVYVTWHHNDDSLGLDVARRLKALDLRPIALGDGGDGQKPGLANADFVVYCWGQADEGSILNALSARDLQDWADTKPGRLVLFAGGPTSKAKANACALDSFYAAEMVLDGTMEKPFGRLEALLRGDEPAAG